MVVGRRITKGGKQTKWEVKQQETHETITQIKQEVTIIDIRETEKEGNVTGGFSHFSTLYLLTSSVLPTVTRESYSVRLSEGERSLAGEALIDHMHTQVYSLMKCFYV